MDVKESVSTSTEASLSFIADSIWTAASSSMSTVSRTWLQFRSGMWALVPRGWIVSLLIVVVPWLTGNYSANRVGRFIATSPFEAVTASWRDNRPMIRKRHFIFALFFRL